jgi:hypothetical protein
MSERNVHMVKGWKASEEPLATVVTSVARLEARLEALEENVQLLNRWIETFKSMR